MNPPTSWENPAEIIEAELEPGETLLWAGRPTQGIVLRPADVRQMVSGLIVIAFIVFSIVDAKKNFVANDAFFLLAVPVLLYNATLIFARPILDWRFRARMAYGVTSHRVMFVAWRFGHRIKSLELDCMVDVRLQAHGRSGNGVIRFGSDAGKPEPADAPTSWIKAREMTAFELDKDAIAVFRLIHQSLRPQPRTRDRSVVTGRRTLGISPVWDQPEEIVQSELQPDEILLWSGRPRQGIIPNWTGILGMAGAFVWMILFHVVMLGGAVRRIEFSILWVIVAIKMFGFLVKIMRAFGDARSRARMAYAVTTTRALIVSSGGGRLCESRSLALPILADISLTERNESSEGVVLVGPDVPRSVNAAAVAHQGGTPAHMLRFELGQDARLVYRLLRRTRRPVAEAT